MYTLDIHILYIIYIYIYIYIYISYIYILSIHISLISSDNIKQEFSNKIKPN